MSESLPLWVHLFRVVVAFGFFLITTALLIWAERRVLGRMQARLGPNRAGPFGIAQTLVDGVKMFFKEDVTPRMVDKPVYFLAPMVGVVAGFAVAAIIPLGGQVTLFGETFVLQVADPEIGVLFFLAMGSLHVYSVFLAGWASTSPYPLIGGVRAGAQMISYEIAQGLAIASVFIYAGSLRVSDIVAVQASTSLVAGMPGWFAIPLFPAFVVFVVGMVAEAGRFPFDLAEAEGELVAGFHTEYSGLKFGMFMLAEFLNVPIMSAIAVTLFFGGPSGPTFGAPGAVAWIFPILWFLLKTGVFIFFFILLRGALPRMRWNRLLDLGWKVLIPVALVWTLFTAAIVLLRDTGAGVLTGTTRWLVLGVGLVVAAAVYVVPAIFGQASNGAAGGSNSGRTPAGVDKEVV